MFIDCRLLMWFLSVSSFLNILDLWFSRINGITLVICRVCYSLLFGVNQDSVLKNVLWTIIIYIRASVFSVEMFYIWPFILGHLIVFNHLISHVVTLASFPHSSFFYTNELDFSFSWGVFAIKRFEKKCPWIFCWHNVNWSHECLE